MSIGTPGEFTSLASPPSDGLAGIVVVDEDPAFRLGLKTFLREYVGFESVFVADNGIEALQLIEREEAVEVITLDYQMPGMNGIEMLEVLRENLTRPVSVIMITGYPSEDLESKFRSFQSTHLLANYFLSKPVEFEKLEPILLRAHEEVVAAKIAAGRRSLSRSDSALEAVPLTDSDQFTFLHSQLAHQSQKLDRIQSELTRLGSRVRCYFWTFVVLVLLGWAGWHSGWSDRIGPAWQAVKTLVEQSFSPPAEPAAGEDTPSTPAEDGPGLEPVPPSSPTQSGRPL